MSVVEARPEAPPELAMTAGAAGRKRPRAHLWLRMASYGWERPQRTIEERERVRRSQLAAWVVLGLLVVDLFLLPVGIGGLISRDTGTFLAWLAVLVGLLLAAALNRRGLVDAAGAVLVLVLCGAIMGAIVFLPDGLSVDSLPAYDLLGLAVIVAASIMFRGAGFVVAGLNVLLIILDFSFQRYDKDLVYDFTQYGDVAAATVTLLFRPIALNLMLAIVSFLWVRGMDRAVQRADRAEEFAALEHQVAEQKRQLDAGIQEILATQVRVANGDFSARAPIERDNVLFQVSSALNTLIQRLHRASGAEYELQRAREEALRLAEAVRDVQSHRPPLWPAPSGTILDPLIYALRGGTAAGSTTRRPLPTEQGAPRMAARTAAAHALGPAPRLAPIDPAHTAPSQALQGRQSATSTPLPVRPGWQVPSDPQPSNPAIHGFNARPVATTNGPTPQTPARPPDSSGDVREPPIPGVSDPTPPAGATAPMVRPIESAEETAQDSGRLDELAPTAWPGAGDLP